MTPQLRQAVLALTAVLALGAVCAVRLGIEARSAEPAPRPARATQQPSPAPIDPPPAGMPSRNVFEFADRAAPPPVLALPPVVVPSPLAPEIAPVPTVSPLRLVGFVRRGRMLSAALSLEGQLAVLGVGEESDGYVVLAIDEDVGVTLRTPDGAQRVLVPESP